MTLDAQRVDQTQDYARAGFGQELQPGQRPALVLVDPAIAYTDPASPLFAGVEDAVVAMRELLAAARAARIPVVVTEVRLRADGSDAGLFFQKARTLSAFCAGSPYGAIIDGLEPRTNELLLTKKYASAFFGTTLNSYLNTLRVDTVLLGGLSTSGCIRATALDTLQHGFIPIVAADAVGDRDEAIHDANLFDIKQKMAEVWTLDRVRDYLSHRTIQSSD